MQNKKDTRPIMVAIKCITYNHEPYIRQCLEGFVMQQTNFRFVAIVHDDASTDGTAAIIREYEEKYPDIIKPIYETENQYSKQDGSLRRIMNEAIDATGCKYIALCEGDDYWVDPFKLQKQVDYMERNRDCSFCTHKAYLVDAETNDYLSISDVIEIKDKYKIEDAIKGFGRYMATSSFLFRCEILSYIPNFVRISPCGDYTLPIVSCHFGYIGYLPEIMSSYRVGAKASLTTSWRGNFKKREEYNRRYDAMLLALDIDTGYKYSKLIKEESINLWVRTYLEYGMYENLSVEPYKSTYLKLPVIYRLQIYVKNKLPKSYVTLQIIKRFINNRVLCKGSYKHNS